MEETIIGAELPPGEPRCPCLDLEAIPIGDVPEILDLDVNVAAASLMDDDATTVGYAVVEATKASEPIIDIAVEIGRTVSNDLDEAVSGAGPDIVDSGVSGLDVPGHACRGSDRAPRAQQRGKRGHSRRRR